MLADEAPDGPRFRDAYRNLEASLTPLDWDSPLADSHSMSLSDYLMSLLDVHVNSALTSNILDFILGNAERIATGAGCKNVRMPSNRQEYEAAVRKLEDNTRFFLTCAAHCQPCGRDTTYCPTCGKPTIVSGKPAGLFYVRDPRKWLRRLLDTPALRACLRYAQEHCRTRVPGSAATDVWDAKLFEWLLRPNAEPLR